MVETAARRRKGGEGEEPAKKEKTSDEKPKKEKEKPFQGRYNPKFSDRNALVSHKTLGKTSFYLTRFTCVKKL
jgi:hypothetical protein